MSDEKSDEMTHDISDKMTEVGTYTSTIDMARVMKYITTNYNGYYGTRFVATATNADFFEASGACRDLGGTLPCIKNIVQQEAVAKLNNGTVWLGGIDYYDEGVWECESGDSLVWTNWAENQPDDKVRLSFKI